MRGRLARDLALATSALVITGCGGHAWTAAAVAEARGPNPTGGRQVSVPARLDAWLRWQLPPTLPWARYEKLTLLASLDDVPRPAVLPDVMGAEIVQRAEVAAVALARRGIPDDVLVVVDLRGAASVAFGAALSHRASAPVALVPTFNHWPAEDEMIPAVETLTAMLEMAPRLPPADATRVTPVFLLDAWRLAYADEAVPDEVLDNRYFLNAADLPDAATLRSAGIRRVLYVVEDELEAEREEDDLNAPFAAYEAEGLTLAMVDLAGLTQDLDLHDDDRRLVVATRPTILHDHGFFVRARGSFGGALGRPSPFHGSALGSVFGSGAARGGGG